MIVDPTLRALWAAAYVRGLEVRVHEKGDVVVVSTRARTPRLDDTGRAPVVPLRPNGGDSRPCCTPSKGRKVTEDSYRVGTADDVDDVDLLVDDDVPADAPRIHGQIIHVTIRDGAGVREFDVHVTNRDYLAWDMTGPKRGWDDLA